MTIKNNTVKGEHDNFEKLLDCLGFDDDEIYSDLWIIKDDDLIYKTIYDSDYCRMSIFYNKNGNNDYIALANKLLASEFFSDNQEKLIKEFIKFWSDISNFK